MYPRKRLDIGWDDLAVAFWGCQHPEQDPAPRTRRLEEAWAIKSGRPALCTLSVRTALDLALQALALPPGSEVVMAAINIPHMFQILEHHQLVAVPVDLDLPTLTITPEALEAAITPSTRLVLFAHLFGSRAEIAPLIEVAHRHGLLFFEDAAQAFVADGYMGHPEADLSLFSFGSIKSFTALGGAMVGAPDDALLGPMRQIMATYPVQPTAEYVKKLGKHVPLRFVGGSPLRYGALTWAARTFADGHDALVMQLTRGFPGSELIGKLRHRPCGALVNLLARRISRARYDHLLDRIRLGHALCERLEAHVEVLGAHATCQTWWLFPIIVPEPDMLRKSLQDKGFDAALGSTSLTWLPAPDPARAPPVNARRAMTSILYLPLDPSMDEAALDTLAALVIDYLATRRGADDVDPTRGSEDSPAGRPHRVSRLVEGVVSAEGGDADARCA